jgi:signal transduction histidine kinase
MTTSKKTKAQLLAEIDELRRQNIYLIQSEEKRTRVEAELRARVLQQAVVAELGQRVLAGIDLPALLNEATTLVAKTLKVEFCQVLELLPDRDILLLRAGVGWQPGLVGKAVVDARPDSQEGYTLFSSEPVIVDTLSSDTRFKASPLLQSHCIVSGVSVIIDAERWPFGILSIHTAQHRVFTRNDINILQAVANVLATAIEHKRTQQALQVAYDQLELRVKERTAELEGANEELKTFAYTVSHDLRAPLVNIKGFAGELRATLEEVWPAIESLFPHLDEQQRQVIDAAFQQDIPEAVHFIDSSINRMDSLVSAILKLSRLGRKELDFEPVEMKPLAQNVLQSLAHQIEQRQVTIQLRPLPNVVADRTAMEQIMGNILNNAVVYLDSNRPGQIEISGQRYHHETRFQVRDNGRGIAVEDRHKIFELFRRAGKQDVPGEGMGLAYVRTLVRRHGGRIWFESQPDVGTTFFFTIPHNLPQGENDANHRGRNYSAD